MFVSPKSFLAMADAVVVVCQVTYGSNAGRGALAKYVREARLNTDNGAVCASSTRSSFLVKIICP